MSVVDLNSRITEDWEKYNSFNKSSSSYIYIHGPIYLDESGPATLDITVGNSYFDYHRRTECTIPEKGIKLSPGKSVLLTAEQKIAVPLNVYGIVIGKGKNIFNGCFVSSGKINPGYNGNLQIGFLNCNNHAISIKKGDLLACCSFFNIETYMKNPLQAYQRAPDPIVVDRGISGILIWIKDNWYSVVSLLISAASFICAYLALNK